MPHRSFQFGKTHIGQGFPCFIVAEIGINHEGCVDTCLKMVKVAAEAGANAIKLQTSDPDENYHPSSTSYQIYQKAFLSPEETSKIFNYTRELGLEPFTTSGLKTLEWVEKLKPSGYKISSGLFSHRLLIEETVKKARPVILSTGLSTYEDIDGAVQIFEKHQLQAYAILQCTSLYPCEDKLINLSSVLRIINKYGAVTGFSDHSLGINTASYAVAAGAKIIEKHFSLDAGREGFDHKISLNYQGFKEMTGLIRHAEILLGQDDKKLDEKLIPVRERMERYIFSGNNLEKNHILKAEDLLFLRSDVHNKTGLSALHYESILGKKLNKNIDKLEPINMSDVNE